MKKNTFYVTTPIYYVTAKPHLGHLYSTLLADVAARWHRLRGFDVFFLTGTDEHGQKIAQAAEKAGKEPQKFVDSFISAYKKMWDQYEIGYTDFIRTTDERHKKAVHALLEKLIQKGDIYKDSYEGWYCTPCELFLSEKESKTANNEDPRCPSCERETKFISEESYFFRLSAYQDKLLAFYKNNPKFIVPKERLKEATSFVEGGLKDLSISRTTVKWGIPFPNDPEHTVYVWADALTNYIAAIGYGNPQKQELFDHWWPASLQVLGKDIVRFHAVYWPAFLMAADLPLPKRELVHGWITVDRRKMSKSLGNVVDPQDLFDTYGCDPVRYYFIRKMAITHDSSMSYEDIEQTITSDLANDLGNLLNRVVQLAHKYDLHEVQAPKVWDQSAIELREACWNTIQDMSNQMSDYQFHMALAKLWEFVHKVNAYLHDQQPWKVAKSDPQKFAQVISAASHSLHAIGLLAWPVMPKKMRMLIEQLGHSFKPEKDKDVVQDLDQDPWQETYILKKSEPLFTKPDSDLNKVVPSKEQQEVAKEKKKYIDFDTFVSVELRVGTIKECEPVEKSEKLLKMQVDFGDLGMRQIMAGLRKFYSADDLIGKRGVFVYNLKPRKMLGLESQGMMLVATDAGGKPIPVSIPDGVADGERLH